jgi:hypothetical protein
MTTFRRARLAPPLAAILALTPIGGVSLAQNARPEEPTRPTPAASEREAAARDFPLQQNRSNFPALGVSVRLPENAVLQSSEIGTDRQSLSIFARDGRWSIRILDRRARDVALTPDEVAVDLIQELRATRQQIDPSTGRVGAGVSIDPGEPDLTIGQSPAAQFYAGFLSNTNQPVITGYTIALIEPGRFVIFQLDTTAQHAGVALDVYERVLHSVEMRNPADLAASRASAIKTGHAFINSLAASEYLAALPEDPIRWTRTVAPDPAQPDGMREVGYQRVEMRTGKRGELNPQKPSSRWSTSELDDGLLVKIEARAVLGTPTNPTAQIVDSQAIYWMKLDATGRGEESWSMRMILKERGEESMYTEVGARLGNQLTVTVNAPGTPPVEKRWRIPDEGYIAQAETHLLPLLMARAGNQADMAFYAYSSALNELKLRREQLTSVRDDETGENRPPRNAAWRLRTEVTEGAAPRIYFLSDTGEFVRGQLPDGSIIAPTRPEELRAVWQRKGLPTN